MTELIPQIEKASQFVNSIETDYELECLSTICFIVDEKGALEREQIIQEYKFWSKDKSERFPEEVIDKGINRLYELDIIDKNIMGYIISR